MYFLLSGKQPFKGKNVSELLSNILKGSYGFHDKKWKKVSEEAKDLIRKLLIVQPFDRISIVNALNHPWFSQPNTFQTVNLEIFNSIKSFKAHGKL